MKEFEDNELKSTGRSSDHFGKCDVCGKEVSEVYVLTSFSHLSYYGHQDCLKKSLTKNNYERTNRKI